MRTIVAQADGSNVQPLKARKSSPASAAAREAANETKQRDGAKRTAPGDPEKGGKARRQPAEDGEQRDVERDADDSEADEDQRGGGVLVA